MTDNHSSRARLDAIARLRATMAEEELGVADRIAHLQAQHCVMARDEQLAKHIADMKRSLISAHSDDDKQRRILFIVGESNSGKTECLRHVLANTHLAPYSDEHGEARPLLWFKMPTPCTLRNIAVECLRNLGFPVRGDITESRVWPILREQLKQRRVLFLVLDEAQRTMKMDNEFEIQKVSDTLITLVEMEDWPMRLILVGVPQLEQLRTRDDQMRNRSQIMRLNPVPEKLSGRVEGWLKEIVVQHAGLGLGDLPIHEYAERLIKACEGNVGSIVLMVRSTATFAILEGREVVKESDFAKAYHQKSACTPEANLFEVANWRTLEGGKAKIDENDAGNPPVIPAAKQKPGERPR